jgi:hypothetical protein
MVRKLTGWLLGVTLFMVMACEDATQLNSVSQTFSRSSMRTAYIDTFSVFMSTVQLDTFPTSGTGTVLLGSYKDTDLGSVTSSSYFQIAPSSSFTPDTRFLFDSIALVLPLNKYSYGDTTKPFTLRMHELTEDIKPRLFTASNGDVKVSYFASGSALYNVSKFAYKPDPIFTTTIPYLTPHRTDSLFIRLPDDLGLKWFTQAQHDTIDYFTNNVDFILNYFKGVYMAADDPSNAAMLGINASKVKIRLYYRTFVNDIAVETHFDLPLTNTSNQFNHVDVDRSGTAISSLKARGAISSKSLNNVSYVQSGTGLMTRLDFPSVKAFFSDQNLILVNSYLLVYPIQNTYNVGNALPPSSLALYTTDISNMPLGAEPSTSGSGILSSPITYDKDFGLQTLYSFSMITYMSNEIRSTTSNVLTPLMLGSLSSNLGTTINRVYLGDMHNPKNKIKLLIYYSYALN